MKKCMLIALIVVFVSVSVGAICSAQDSLRRVTNTSKKGSLLVYPLIKVGPPGDGNDTIVFIANDYPKKVRINCQYATPKDCACDSFSFTLTANQSIAFSAKTGFDLDGNSLPRRINLIEFPTANDQYVGELRCWATSPSGAYNISWNHLYGSAIVVEGDNQTWEYSAWRFAVGYAVGRGNAVKNALGSNTKILRLTGMPDTYDACPEKLIFNFINQVENPDSAEYGEGLADNRLTLIPCKQDCVTTPVRAHFRIYDEYENDRQETACYGCDDNASGFFSKSLSDTNKFGIQDWFVDLGTPGGMAIVENTPDGTCGETYGIPMLGVISNRFNGVDGPVAGESLTTLGRAQPYLTDADGVATTIEVQMEH